MLGYFLTLCLFLTAVLKLRFEQVHGLIPFFLTGVVLNLTAGLIQYSYSGQAIITDLFSYELKAGFFRQREPLLKFDIHFDSHCLCLFY